MKICIACNSELPEESIDGVEDTCCEIVYCDRYKEKTGLYSK